MSDPVEIVDYDPQWPQEFHRLAERARDAIGDLAAGVEHVGATSVPELSGKPIVDLYVLVRSRADVPAATERLEAIGYCHQGDLGLEGREAFAVPQDEARHHLYLAALDNDVFRRSVEFRDYLRTHADEAAAYAELKRELASRHRDDRAAYGDAKSEFVERALRLAAGTNA